MRDLTGQRFGRLLAVRIIARKGYDYVWECLCDCGNGHNVYAGNLTQGRIRSCGCFRNAFHVTHGESGSGAYSSWAGMIQRCTNPNNERWKDYGGRGVIVCERWRSFENFLADMGQRPEGCSLERRDNNGIYEPGNCYWAKPLEQMNNTRRNRFIEHDGKRQTLTQWAREYGINPHAVQGRLRKGWTIETALTTPVRDKQARACAECETVFQPEHPLQRYCGRRCKQRRDNRVARAGQDCEYLESIQREEEMEVV